LFGWEVILELLAATRQRRRDIRPRGHRGGYYPFLRAALCVVVRDLIVFGVLTDMMSGRPAVYATFSSYDEVAHHSGLERADTMEEPRRLTLEEIEQRHPRLLGALREHPHIGFLLVYSAEHGPVVLGARGTCYLATGRIDGEDPLAGFSNTASAHLQRTDSFE